MPLPLFSNTDIVLLELAVTMSGLPSRLKSPTATEVGGHPDGVGLGGPEGAIAIVQEHDGVPFPGRHDVRFAVAIEVANSHVQWVGPPGEAHPGKA